MNFYPAIFLSHVNDYIEPMATFTTWVKFYFTTSYIDDLYQFSHTHTHTHTHCMANYVDNILVHVVGILILLGNNEYA